MIPWWFSICEALQDQRNDQNLPWAEAIGDRAGTGPSDWGRGSRSSASLLLKQLRNRSSSLADVSQIKWEVWKFRLAP